MDPAAMPREGRAELAIGSVRYWTTGRGPRLLFLHPSGGFTFSGGLERLAGSFELTAPVVPGFDGTQRLPGVSSAAQLAGWLASFHQAQIGEAVDVVGHSFGGWLALWFAATHPECVRRLVVAAPARLVPSSPLPPGEVPRLFLHPENRRGSEKPEEVRRGNALASRAYAGSWVDDALTARLSQVAAPTLVLRGTDDQIVPEGTVDLLAAALRKMRSAVIEGAAHGIDTDQPLRYAQAVSGFLTEEM